MSAIQAGPALVSYRQPHRAIVWALANHNIGLDEAANIKVGAAASNGSTITTSQGTLDIDPSLRPAVRAQRTLRTGAGAATDAPLLPHTPKTLGYALTDAAHDLGLAAHGRLSERHNMAPRSWLKKLGITVRPLP